MAEDTWRWCRKCGEWKPALTGFYARKTSSCRVCQRAYYIKRYQPIRDELHRIKLASGCVDCGYDAHPEALEFDHRLDEEKVAPVAHLVFTADWERVMEEVAKCEVVCSNCHHIRSAERRQSCADWDLRRKGIGVPDPGPPPWEQLRLVDPDVA